MVAGANETSTEDYEKGINLNCIDSLLLNIIINNLVNFARKM